MLRDQNGCRYEQYTPIQFQKYEGDQRVNRQLIWEAVGKIPLVNRLVFDRFAPQRVIIICQPFCSWCHRFSNGYGAAYIAVNLQEHSRIVIKAAHD